jgi:hypothetical protein
MNLFRNHTAASLLGLVLLPAWLASAEEGEGTAIANQTGDSITTTEATNEHLKYWGLDIIISDNGFGLGTFYRKQFTTDLAWSVSLAVSGAKDDREMDYYDPYTGQSITPGKLNRFLVVPLLAALEYRLFSDDIVDTFRPYINAAVGPTMVYMMPYVTVTNSGGVMETNQVDFFNAIGKGHPYYTVGSFIGAGANFGSEKANVFGVNIRYYFIYLMNGGLPSLYDQGNPQTIEVTSYKSDFGGFAITLNLSLSL